MSVFEKIIDPLTDHLKERLNSPFLYSFITAWCIWNYRFIVVLFSDASISTTFQIIDKVIYPDFSTTLLKGVIAPSVSALIYIFAYPYPAKYIYTFVRRRQKELLEIQRNIDNETPLTNEESRKIRLKMAALEEDLNEKLFNKNLQINQLTDELAEYRKSNANSRTLSEKLYQNRLEKSQAEILSVIEKMGGQAGYEKLIKQNLYPKTQFEYDLEELLKNGYLSKKYEIGFEDYVYSLTQLGRKYLLDIRRDNEGD